MLAITVTVSAEEIWVDSVNLQFDGWSTRKLPHQIFTQKLVLGVWIDVTEKERHTRLGPRWRRRWRTLNSPLPVNKIKYTCI